MTKIKGSIGIMFLGGARRVAMAKLFRKAANDAGLELRLYSYELGRREPIADEADIIIGRKWNDPEVYAHLAEISGSKNIDVIIPFVDGAVGIAARFISLYPGKVWSPVSIGTDPDLMFDKVLAAKRFEELGLPIPATYIPGEPCMQLIAKPRKGSASKGIRLINSIDTLNEILSDADRYLIQRYIPNRKEYSVDCYVSRHGDPLCIVPRERLEVIGGEVTRTITVDAPDIIDLARKTLNLLELTGAVTIQMIRDMDNGALMLMEINPRLGGGAVCAVQAGADIPSMIISESQGLTPVASCNWITGTEICRYMQEVVFLPDNITQK